MSVIVLHNPRCRKSREAVHYLEEKSVAFETRLYLEDKLNVAALKVILEQLQMSAFDLARRTEQVYKDQVKGKDLGEDALIKLMVDHPKLIERPIIIKGDKAVVGRPKELIDTIL